MNSEFDHDNAVAEKMAAARDPGPQRSPLDVSLDPLITLDLSGKIIHVNEVMVALIGLPRESVLGTRFSDWFTAPDLASAFCARVIADTFVTDYPLTIRHENGRLTNLVFNASSYSEDGGKRVGLFLAARDVTRGRATEQQFRTFFEAAPDAMVQISSDGIILLMNSQTESLFGYSRNELMGKAVEMLVPARFRGGHPGHRSKFFAEPRIRPMGQGLDLWGLRADGTEFPI
jgi:PAS domain S-box-containing protein